MEKLSQQQQEAVRKMSTERLHVKLMACGYDEEMVLGLDRAGLLSTYAELLSAGKVGTPAPPVLSYDIELEKQKFEFEQKKWAEQKKLEEDHLVLCKQEFEREQARKESAAAKGKLFGDAMRASAICMGPDIMDIIPFFKNVENLFKVFAVPGDLQAVLIRPFLNDKAKILLTRLDPTIAADYEQLKDAMLRKFQLSPAKYLERFNMYEKPETETYVMYASKLSALLDYYLESRLSLIHI